MYFIIVADDDDDDDIFSSSTGAAVLCQTLVRAFEIAILKPHEFYVSKSKAVNALKSLLAISSSAKIAALEGELLLKRDLVDSTNSLRHAVYVY